MWDPLLETSGKIVGFYEREFSCFSNFSSFAVFWKDRSWQTSEHAYQASKFIEKNPEIAEEIYDAKSAHDAFRIGRKFNDKKLADWESLKTKNMEDICWNKLQQHPYIQQKLLETENMEIVEDSPKDSFWGWGPNRDGRNELGKVWMKLRDKLKNN